jgi:TRAP-type uncharacterized transport system substrate-binding protein
MGGKTWRWIATLLFLVIVLMALRLIGPKVPNEIRMVSGREGTTFYDNAMRYKEFLGRHGVTVRLEQTSGSVENLSALIEAEEPTVGFVSGLLDASGKAIEVPEGVESLGTMYLQPLWVFGSKELNLDRLRDLSGMRIEAGSPGSDARLMAFFVLGAEGIRDEVDFRQDSPMTPEEVLETARSDEVAAIITVGEPDSELIDLLLRSSDLQVLSVQRAEAFAIRYPFLRVVYFPEGAHDIGDNIPDEDLQLLAVRAQLLVSAPFPPALADLLLQAASEIHGQATAFSSRGEFPGPLTTPLPLNRAADDFYTKGPSKLQKFLPFRLAAWVERFLTAAVAIASAAVTIFRIVPALISLPFKMKIKRAYSELHALEKSAASGTDQKTLLEGWAKVDESTGTIKVPMRSLEPQWLELRQYLHDMRDRL